MILRMKEIVTIFETRGDNDSSRFLLEFAEITKPDIMAKRLGLLRHPVYQEAVPLKVTKVRRATADSLQRSM